MSRILLRRSIDAKINSILTIPIQAFIPAKVEDIIAFLNGHLDMQKISDILSALSMIDITYDTKYPWKNIRSKDTVMSLPEAYMIMKLIYPPSKTEKIPFNTSVLDLLYAGRIDDAYTKASYMLYSHGLPPFTSSKRTGVAQNMALSDVVKRNIMASLLIPISNEDRNNMLRQVIIHDDDT